jgi:hypothetical protein
MVEKDDFVLKGIEMEIVRFEPMGLPFSIQPALAYWLRLGDTIAPRWRTVEHHWERKGVMCSFDLNTSNADCQVCDYCNLPASLEGPPCRGLGPFGNFSNALGIVVDYGFIQTDNPALIGYWDADIYAACSNATQGPPRVFAPVANGLYRLRSVFSEDEFNIRGGGVFTGQIKLYVVHNDEGDEQTAPYELVRRTIAGKNYWTWEMTGENLWLENFSPSLRVTDIRIFKGACADSSAEAKQCPVPDGSPQVKPSRILFLQDFRGVVPVDGGCYSDPNASGGNFINLDSCRETYNTNQTIRKFTTPTYESTPGAPRPMQKLTWLVEFDTSKGADADLMEPGNQSMMADDMLIIEFTIQAN